jgi:hypothetical protein
MSATKWKTRQLVRPYSPRNWAIPHVHHGTAGSEAEPRPSIQPDFIVIQEPIHQGGFILGGMPGSARHARGGRKDSGK